MQFRLKGLSLAFFGAVTACASGQEVVPVDTETGAGDTS